jgi:type IV pilus assembly protein PilA
MNKIALRSRQLGQGMTEYIIIVALIAVAAIGVYQAFGDIIRGQTSVAASTLAGADSGGARKLVTDGQKNSNNRGKQTKALNDFENDSK